MLIRSLMALLLSLVLSPTWGAVPPTAPDVFTSAASGLSTTGATLMGTVSSNGAITAVTFDYGLTAPGYGSTATGAGSPLAAGATNTVISAAVAGLVCGTTYHYRVNGTNSAGTTNGRDAAFITSACVPTLGLTASTSASPISRYVSFNLQATNSNSTDLSNVTLTDVLPAGMTYKSNATAVGTVSVAGQTLTWIIPTLPAGGSVSLILVVQLTQKGTLTNTVTSPGAASASVSILVLPSAITHYHMDEPAGSWTGSANDVWDSGGNKLNGHRRTTATPTTTNAVSPSPTIAAQYSSVVGDFCNAGNFDGNAVVESASSPYFQFTQTLSASAWIYPTELPSGNNIYSILSNDTNYEFHLDSSGHLYWWWYYSTLTSSKSIPLNHWTHIAITFDSSLGSKSRQIIYINGVPDTNTNNWSGTLNPNACPFYIGGDIATSNPPGKSCDLIQQRNFHGKIDEAKIYDYELSAAEVNADMTLGRLCNGAFDHIEIDHDGSASFCTQKTVTLKACLDVNCTALYTDQVTVKLSPSGWLPGDTVTFDGGVTTATLNNTSISPPSLTLGAVSMSPTANNKTRCFNGATETCTLSVPSAANTTCLFDAVEPGAQPHTHLYTKLAGKDFNVDLLALNKGNTSLVDTGYTGTVSYDLVDACPNGTVLNTTGTQSYTYALADKGRKTVSMKCTTATPSVQVRMKVGSLYACSTDKFAVRPSAATLTTTTPLATTTADYPDDPIIIKAGALFNIGATTTQVGYTGVLTPDSSKLTAQSGGTAGTLAILPTYPVKANNPKQVDNATYSEVGYLHANAGAFSDSSFTNVDQIGQVAGCAATDTCDCLLSPNSTNNNGVPDYVSDTLINGRYGCYVGNTASKVFGRFIPDHFDTAVTPTPGCESFYYSGQPITVQVTAMNALGGSTANYDNARGFSKAVTLSYSAAPVVKGSLSSAGILANAFINGTASGAPAFTFDKPPGAPAIINLRAADAETSSLPTIGTVTEGSTNIVSGRLRLISGQGSELAPFWMQTEVQRFNAGGFWETSTNDSCTSYATGNFLVTPVPGTSVSTVKPINKGFGSILLRKPVSGGTATICLDMAATAGGCAGAAAASLGYLRGNWKGATTFTKDPSATVQFGGANSNSRGNWGYLYRRENF